MAKVITEPMLSIRKDTLEKSIEEIQAATGWSRARAARLVLRGKIKEGEMPTQTDLFKR